jgi:hypothetical protein
MKSIVSKALVILFLLSGALPAQQKASLTDRIQTAEKARQELWQAKKYAEAVRLLLPFYESGEFIDLAEGERGSLLYNLACGYALLNDKAKALSFLAQSMAAGFRDYDNAKQDADFANIRKDPEFEAILGRLRHVGDYGLILKEYAGYRAQPEIALPAFQYQEAAAEKLAELRRTYNLDEAAGTGDEVSRLINLMRWVHKAIRHDGNSSNPEPRNALRLLQVCRDEKRGVNCRMLATVLNEVYLAMGFPSRHITCMPKWANDPDCHVVNIVYAESLGKWLYMDPSFEAYFKNAKGDLLSIAEVREELAAGRKPILDKEANWNGQTTSPDWYLNYMSKNLFRFFCPISSEFGYESKPGAHTYIYLEPADFAAPKSTETNIHVTDPARFWSLPGTNR